MPGEYGIQWVCCDLSTWMQGYWTRNVCFAKLFPFVGTEGKMNPTRRTRCETTHNRVCFLFVLFSERVFVPASESEVGKRNTPVVSEQNTTGSKTT